MANGDLFICLSPGGMDLQFQIISIFRSGGSLALTLSGHIMSRLISKMSINQELHNMVKYPDIVKHSEILNRSSKVA